MIDRLVYSRRVDWWELWGPLLVGDHRDEAFVFSSRLLPTGPVNLPEGVSDGQHAWPCKSGLHGSCGPVGYTPGSVDDGRGGRGAGSPLFLRGGREGVLYGPCDGG